MITCTGVCSIKGLKSRPNEDRYRILGGTVPLVAEAQRGHLFAVIDGAGGAPEGMRAAQYAADRLADFYRDQDLSPSWEGLLTLLSAISRTVHGWGMIEGISRTRGAAAITVAWFAPQREVVVLHAGDTLAARFNGDRITRLTQNHSEGHTLLRYLGQGEGFTMDVVRAPFEEGDVLCLATDGVTRVMEVDEIGSILSRSPDPNRAAAETVQRARGKGSPDDITALVVELEEW